MGGSWAFAVPGVLATESFEGRDSRPIIAVGATGVYGWKDEGCWWTEGKGGMPMGCGAGVGFDLALVLIIPPKYWAGGAGEVAEDTEEESYDLVEGFGDRGYGLCDAAAMLEEPRD